MLGGEEGDEVFASTFHSACVRILRRWAESIGYPRSFTIYDTDDSQRVMKAVYKELSIDDKFFPIKSAINQMSRWKDQLVSPEEALRTPARDTKGAIAAKVYAAYEKKLREAGAFDFDDLIYQTVQLLAEHEDVREFYQNKYRYLLVDEYQDTSVADSWATKHHDPDPGRPESNLKQALIVSSAGYNPPPPIVFLELEIIIH